MTYRIIKYFSLFLVFLLNFSCQPSGRKDDIVITATLKGPGGMAMIKMIDETPVFDSIKTIFLIKNEPNQVRDLMFREAVDFAVLPTTMAAMLYNKDLPYILTAIPVWGTLHLFGSDSAITGWSDLKGKKVSLMGKGMTPDIMFRFLAKKNGLDPDSDLVADYSFPTHIELANAIASGVSDLAVISEPLVSMVISKNPKVRSIFDFNTEWINIFGDSIPFAQTALLVHKDLQEKNPLLVDQYLHELEMSIEFVNSNIENASILIEEYGILPDRQIAEQSIPRCHIHFTPAWEEKDGIEEYLKVFFNFNPLSIGGKLPDASFYFKIPAD